MEAFVLLSPAAEFPWSLQPAASSNNDNDDVVIVALLLSLSMLVDLICFYEL